MLTIIVSCVLLVPAFVYFDFHNKCYTKTILICNNISNTVSIRYRKFRKINKLVSTTYKGFFTIFWISLCMIMKVLWLYIIQYFNSTVTLTGDNKYIISYVIKGKLYKMIIKPNRGPSKVLLVSDENHEDISNLVFPYLGPEENFHNSKFTPRFFSRKELVFELSNGLEKTFNDDQNIILLSE